MRLFSKKAALIQVHCSIYSGIALWTSVNKKFKIILENKDPKLNTDKTI